MAESQEERNERVSRDAIEAAREFTEDQQKWADENRDDAEVAPESEEEAAERVASVRRAMAFGDMPTDPTTGDPQVPVNDQEGATVSEAEADFAAQSGDEEAQSQDATEKARQDSHGLDEEQLAVADDSEVATEDDGMPEGGREAEAHELSAKEKVKRIKEADSVEAVDEVLDGDERPSVQRAAESRKEELQD
jgi:hypothetical protein